MRIQAEGHQGTYFGTDLQPTWRGSRERVQRPLKIEVPRDAPGLAMLGQSPVSNMAVYNCPHSWR